MIIDPLMFQRLHFGSIPFKKVGHSTSYSMNLTNYIQIHSLKFVKSRVNGLFRKRLLSTSLLNTLLALHLTLDLKRANSICVNIL